jgi:phospholipase C
MPEVLNEAGVAWKVYNPDGFDYVPGSGFSMTLGKNILMYFEQSQKKVHPKLDKRAFGYYGPNVVNAFGTKGPDNFAADIKHGNCPPSPGSLPPPGTTSTRRCPRPWACGTPIRY